MAIAGHLIAAELAAQPTDEWHIAGVVVHAQPARLDDLRRTIEAMSGVEVHAANDQGKLVVTIEGPSTRFVSAHIDALQKLPGVLSAALVYQHYEDAQSMDQEMSDGLLA